MTASRALVTGGAGFIGSNLADRLAQAGHEVTIVDSLRRPGSERNLAWLRARHPQRIAVVQADVRDREPLEAAAAEADVVFHLAGQVAVTTSMADPLEDFAINVAGTVHLLDALRRRSEPPPLVFASTNKVYGDLATSRWSRPTTPTCRKTTASAAVASAKTALSTSTRPMAVPRARRTSTCWTTPAPSACPPSSCA